jgi:hypothetical protein
MAAECMWSLWWCCCDTERLGGTQEEEEGTLWDRNGLTEAFKDFVIHQARELFFFLFANSIS